MSHPIVVQALGVVILLVLALLFYSSAARLKTQAPASRLSSSTTLPCQAHRAVPQQAPATAPLVSPTRLAGYRLDVLLGKGFFGWVYRASAPNGAPVALKFVRNMEAGYREALLLSHLSHPGIPRLEAAFPTPDGYCLVQELVPGETLRARLHRCGGRLPVTEVLHLGGQLAATLADLHQHPQPILHQDVKPDNAMVTPRGAVTLLDFGLAVPPGGVVRGGTLAYMAPEQLKGCADPRSDVYALGITLWELLCGQLPHPECDQFPTLPAETPVALRRLLRQMLQFRCSQRPPSWQVASILGRLASSQTGGPP